MDYVVSEWLRENKLAVETGIKVEMAESLIESLRDIVSIHNIKLDESTLEVVSDLSEEVEKLEEKANDATLRVIALKEENDRLRAEIAFNEIAEGMTLSQIEKLRSLSESLDYSNLNKYVTKLNTIKEAFVEKRKVLSENTDFNKEDESLNESTSTVVKNTDADVQRIMAALANARFK